MGALLAYNDDNSSACGSYGPSYLTFVAAAGQHYQIQIGGYGTESGSGTVTISCDAPILANDICSGALPIYDGWNTVTNIDATDGSPDCETTYIQANSWYRYDPTCNGYATFSLCADAANNGAWDTYCAASCPVSESQAWRRKIP